MGEPTPIVCFIWLVCRICGVVVLGAVVMDFREKGDPAMKAPPEHRNVGQAGGSTGKQQGRSSKPVFAFPQQSTELPIRNATDVLKI